MNKVQKLYDYTNELITLLENESKMDRDEKIEMIHKYLGKREEELASLSAPFTAQEMELGRELIQLNQKLNLLLNQEKFQIQKDIKELHAKKESNKKYTNPYESLITGGVLYDKRE